MPIMLPSAMLMVLALTVAENTNQPAEEAASSGLAADDECSSAGPGLGDHCALNILQHALHRRGLARGGAQAGIPSGSAALESAAAQPRAADLALGPATVLEARPGKWCAGAPAPRLWKPADGPPLRVKVLSYNLYWWNLFGVRHGNNGSAGKLIAGSMHPQPYDFMGFQECQDPKQVLAGVGLLREYSIVAGGHALCLAYAKSRWALLAHGQQDVAEDMPMHWYGNRSAQWMRLQHFGTKRTVLFMNHHGPLSINSGGLCGGRATARNLLGLVAAKAVPGDLLVLVGDFNANAASLTVQELWPHLVHVYNGDSWGGVDNVFSNADASAVLGTKTLGSGGSDHDAIAAVIGLGLRPARAPDSEAQEPGKAVTDLTVFSPGHDWGRFWCGRMELDVDYQFSPASKSWPAEDGRAPDRCCRACQDEPKCRAWRWAKRSPTPCLLASAPPVAKAARPASDVVSGLPAREAAATAAAVARSARRAG